MTTSFDDSIQGRQVMITMKPNVKNLVMVYHPNCKHCQDFRNEYLKYAYEIYPTKKDINVIAVNDGFANLVSKQLPGFPQISYYPTVVLYSPDGSIKEFNPEGKEQFPFTFDGLQ